MNNQTQEINRELTTITKGAILFSSGHILGVGLSFIITLVLVRFLGASIFGLYSLGLVVFGIFSIIARFGLNNGSLKYIAVYRGVEDKKRVKGIIIQSIAFPLIWGSIIGLAVYLFSSQIAKIFQTEDLIPIIKLFAIAIPFAALLPILSGITRGFKTNKYQILAINVIQPLTNLGVIFLVIFCGYSVLGIVWASIIAIILGILFLLYSIKKLFPDINSKDIVPIFETRKLLSTSGILLAIGMISFLVHWTDILMIGHFLPTESVGVYKVTIQIATLVTISISSFNSIFATTISTLYHQKKHIRLQLLFKNITRWGFYFGLLIFLIISTSPSEILQLFGKDFILGKNSLLVLALGQLVNVAVGATGFMLIMTNREKLESLNAICVLILNIILNFILIPKFGILGAAIASATSLSLINIVRIIEIRFSLKIHPFNLKFLKGLGAGIISFLLVLMLKNYLLFNLSYLINLILSSLFILIIFAIFLLLFKLEKEDKFIIKKIKNKL